ncbi:MAG: tetratricopeptide repeat protein [Rhizobiaceae bacterium]
MRKISGKLLGTSMLPVIGLVVGLGVGQPAFAAGGGGGGGGGGDSDGPGTTSQSFVPKCKAGFVRAPGSKFKCIPKSEKNAVAKEGSKKKKKSFFDFFKKKSSSLDQDSIFRQGRSFAYAGDYEKAIVVLTSAPDQGDPRILNMLGFSNRKSGRMDVALGYYRKAVATDPDFSLVREYLGEAYIQLGMMEKAREQLTQIERICGSRVCEEYGQLASLIVKSQTK